MATPLDLQAGRVGDGVRMDQSFDATNELQDITIPVCGTPNFSLSVQFVNCTSIAGNVEIHGGNFAGVAEDSLATIASTANGIVNVNAQSTNDFAYLTIKFSSLTTAPSAGTVRIGFNANS